MVRDHNQPITDWSGVTVQTINQSQTGLECWVIVVFYGCSKVVGAAAAGMEAHCPIRAGHPGRQVL